MEDVDLTPIKNTFSEFFNQTHKDRINELSLHYPSKKSLEVNYEELEKFDPDFADKLVNDPDIYLAAAEEAIKDMNLTLPSGEVFAPHVRFSTLPALELIEHLSSRDIHELVSFRGVVTKRAEAMHRVKVAVYICRLCEEKLTLTVGKNFVPPKRCPGCKKSNLEKVDEECEFVDIQRAEIQELLEKVRGGAPAAKIELWLEDDLVNSITPGENIEVVGIMRLRAPMKPRQKIDMIYGRYMEAVHITSLKRDFEEIEITNEELKKIEELATNPDIERIMISSIAQGIYGHTEVKRALALQLFGGTPGKNMKGMPIRDDIHLLLIGDPGIAKCTDGDAKILLADGSVEKMRDVVERSFSEGHVKRDNDGYYATDTKNIVSLNLDGKIENSDASYFWKLKAPKELYEIETWTGKRVKVTGKHPVFISSNGQVITKPTEKLKKGEFIATPRYLSINGKSQNLPKIRKGKTNASTVKLPKTLNAEFARLLGYIAGDGYVRRTSSYEISLTNCDDTLIGDFSKILKSFLLHSKTKVRNGKRIDTKIITTFSVELGEILDEFGALKRSSGKYVPRMIMKSPNNIVGEFIKAYFDCEASVNQSGIVVASASMQLLESVQLLLMRFGIISQLHETYSRATNSEGHKRTKYYRLSLFGENAAKYEKWISFTSKEKKKKLRKLKKKFNTNIDVVPNLKTILKETRKLLEISQFQCGIPRTTYQHFERGDRNPSNKTLKQIVEAFRKSALSQTLFNEERIEIAWKNVRILEMLSRSDIFWDKIRRVKKTKPKEKWVYDLQVKSTHNFIANNLIIHNSRFLQSVNELAPKSIYVSGKTTTGAGLCVAGDSLVTLNDSGIFEIGELIENNFVNGKKELTNAYSSRFKSKIASVGSDFKANYNESQKIWKIKPPRCMINLQTKRGKELDITPNTSVIAIEEGIPKWKKSSELNENDYIATTKRIVPLEGKKIPIISIINNPNARVHSKSFVKITNKLAKKYGSLMDVAKKYGLDRERLYINRCMKQGVKLEMLKNMAKDAGFSFSDMQIESVFLRYGVEHKLPKYINPDLCYLAGLIAGDGDIHINKSKETAFVRFHSVDEKLLQKFNRLIKRNFRLEVRINKSKDRIPCATIGSMITAKIFVELGIPAGEKSHRLDIPPLLISAGKECVKAYLRGIFDTDGWVSTRSMGSSSVGLCTCSKKLAMKILLLLEWWGIITKVRKRSDKVGKISRIKGKLVKTKKEQYYVEMTGMENIKKFKDNIGFDKKDKKSKLRMLTSKSNKKPNTNLDIIPIMKLLQVLRKKYKLPIQKIGHVYFNRSNPTYKKLKEICQYLPKKSEDRALLEQLANSDIYWDKIKNIEKKKSKDRWVYDFSVDKHHNFIANGIIVHNTVSAEKDELGEGGWTLKAGALVLASGGCAQVDEFDKVGDEDRASMHEAMESGSVSVAKAGIVAKFRTKTAILAAANPKFGRFDQTKNLAEQFDIPPTLLSRFDLIFPIVDVLDEEKDSKLATHILTAHMGEETGDEKEVVVGSDLLRKYIAHARRSIKPRLTREASEKIKEFYIDLRRKSKESGSVAITPRYLEGLVRLAEANAKMRLGTDVEERDAEVSIFLLNHVMKQVMTDKETGSFDVDTITTGKPKSVRDRLQKTDTILEIIREHLKTHDSVEVEAIIQDASSYDIDETTAKRIIKELLRKGELYEKEHGHVRIVGE